MIETLPWHDENTINTFLLHKEHTTLATYHSVVQHTTSSAAHH